MSTANRIAPGSAASASLWSERRIYVLLFALGLSTLVKFRLVGEIFLSDILLIAFFPFAILRARNAPWRYALPIFFVGLLWLLSAMLSDIIRQSPFENYARGWAKIVFFMIAFASLLVLTKTRVDRLMAYFAGLAACGLVSVTFFPDEFQRGEPWKFGYSLPLGMLAVIFGSLPLARRRFGFLRPVGSPAVLAAMNLIFNFRSNYAVLVATAGITALTSVATAIAPRRKIVTPVLVVGLILLAGLAGWGSTAVYSNLAGSGALGDKARQKYEMQTRGDIGVLLGGRSESLVSLQAISESPFIGHGSWAVDRSYVALRVLMLRQHGILTNGTITSELIPSHSYLFGAWVESGVLGAIFWLVVSIYAVIALFCLIDIRSNATPFVAYLLIQLLWSIPFSPFGADVRFVVAGQMCAAIWALREYRKLSRAKTPPPRPQAKSATRPSSDIQLENFGPSQ